jgi:nucleotide-binding universal stress UspA family protein
MVEEAVMFQQLVVPVDGSVASWRAVEVAARMAQAVDGKLDVVTVVDRLADVVPARTDLREGIERFTTLPVEPTTQVLANDSVSKALADHLEAHTGATIVMSSHGHGRSAAVLGNTADELLRLTYGPIVVVGPQAADDAGRLDGNYVVPVDGSKLGEQIVPVAEAWAIEFGAVPWLVEVIDPSLHPPGDVMESAYAARVAHRIHTETGHEVEYDVLHDEKPAKAIVAFADRMEASLAFLTTHGRTGVDRIRIGSVAADVVRHASCPVVLYRPPQLA